MNIGLKIKNLRKQKGITQDQLANQLNISFQTISKWETGLTHPDITYLPELANIFNVSIDYLFDMDKNTQESLIIDALNKTEIYSKELKHKDIYKLWKDLYKKYPNVLTCKYNYIRSLFYYSDKTEYDENETLLIKIANEIINTEVNQYYRVHTINILYRIYINKKDYEKAKQYLKMMTPINFSTELLSPLCEENINKRVQQHKYNALTLIYNLHDQIHRVTFDDDTLTNKDRYEINLNLLNFYKNIFGSDKVGNMSFYFYELYGNLASYATLLNLDISIIIAYLNNAKEVARYYDNDFKNEHIFEGHLFKNIKSVKGDFCAFGGKSLCEVFKEYHLKGDVYDSIRQTKQFKDFINNL